MLSQRRLSKYAGALLLAPLSRCPIDPSARAYVLNATAVPAGYLGFLTLYPAGQSVPLVSNSEFMERPSGGQYGNSPRGSLGPGCFRQRLRVQSDRPGFGYQRLFRLLNLACMATEVPPKP